MCGKEAALADMIDPLLHKPANWKSWRRPVRMTGDQLRINRRTPSKAARRRLQAALDRLNPAAGKGLPDIEGAKARLKPRPTRGK